MQRGGALAAMRVAAHQCAPGVFVQRIEAERLLGVFDRTFEGLIVFEKLDKTRNNLSRALTETFPVRINPLAGTVGEDVAFVQRAASWRAARSPASPRSAAASNATRSTTAWTSARHASVRSHVDQAIQRRPRLSEVVQLAAKIRQRLGIARLGPEGTRDPLTLDRSRAGMKYRKAMSCCCRALGGRAETRPCFRTRNPPRSSTHSAGSAATFQDRKRWGDTTDTASRHIGHCHARSVADQWHVASESEDVALGHPDAPIAAIGRPLIQKVCGGDSSVWNAEIAGVRHSTISYFGNVTHALAVPTRPSSSA